MKEQNQTPAAKDSKKAAEQMKRAVDRTIEAEKTNGHFGNDQGKHEAARELKENAEKDTARRADQ